MLKPIETTKDAIRGAMTFARMIGGRDVILSTDGISVVDGMGRSHPMTRDGIPYKPDLEAFVEEFRLLNRYFKLDEDINDLDSTEEMGDLGDWNFTKKGDAFRLRAKKPSPPCVDGIFKHEPEGLARMRSLYGRDDIDVVVVAEGAPRAREMALALVSERRLVGLPTELDMKPSQDRYGRRSTHSDFEGPEVFDAPGGTAPTWKVHHFSRRDLASAVVSKETPTSSRVFVGETDYYRSDAYAHHVMSQERATVLVEVTLQKSVPTGRIVLNATAMALSSPEPGIPDAPWDRHAEKVARRSSRPAAPKTWHQTTEAVAEAFVARQAPRGYVSGKSLFFHGPVAYSIWDDNPIAAFVKGPDGKPFLLIGRDRELGGGKAAITSMAIGDIQKAYGSYDLPQMEKLETILRLGDKNLAEFARAGRRDKKEHELPDTCHFDEAGLSKWIASEHLYLMKEVESAYSTGVRFPTFKQGRARERVADLAELRDRMAMEYKLNLPDVGNAAELRAEASAAMAAATARHEQLEARKKEAMLVEEAASEAPTP